MVSIEELTVADSPVAWSACGFRLEGDTCVLGEVPVRLLGAQAGSGLVSWSLHGLTGAGELDGLTTGRSERVAGRRPSCHPNGITGIDHVVAITPDLDRTITACQSAGLDLRRLREEPTPAGAPRQAFFRLGAVILEVVQEPQEAIERGGGAERSAFFWGLALLAPDLQATVSFLGQHAGEIRAALQPGRQISSLRRSAGLSVPVALISPPGALD